MSRNINNNEDLTEDDYYPEIEIDDFHDFDKEILEEINFAREFPSEYALKLEEILNSIKNEKTNYLFLENCSFIYNDLIGSLTESINFLKKQKKLPSLSFHLSLLDSCESLLNQYLYNPDYKNNNSTFENRLKIFGKPFGENYEIMCYDMFDPEFIVINLILCDGDRDKFGRKIIFNPNLQFIGIISGFLSPKKICIIINCSEDIFEINEQVPQEIQNKFKARKALYNSKNIPSKITKNFAKKKPYIQPYMLFSKKKENKKSEIKINDDKNAKQRNNLRGKNNNMKDNNYKLRNPPKISKETNNFDYDDFDEDEFFEREFDTNYGKIEKEKNSQKRIFKTSSTTKDGIQKTIITKIVENVDRNGIKKGYYIEEEEKNGGRYILDKEKIEKEKIDMKKIKKMEEGEIKRIANEKYKKKIKEIPIKIKGRISDINEKEYFDEEQKGGNYDIPDGAIDIREERKTITDANGEPVLEIIKTITYEDGSVQKFVDRQAFGEE